MKPRNRMRHAVGVSAVAALATLATLVCPLAARASIMWSASTSFGPATPTTLFGVACPSSNLCDGIDGHGRIVSFDPGHPSSASTVAVDTSTTDAIACPTSRQCTVVDSDGHEATGNPSLPGSAATEPLVAGQALDAVACPSTSLCTAVGQGGVEVTFNPTTPSDRTSMTVGSSGSLTSVSCPSVNQCTAVDEGEEFTYDPSSSGSLTYADVWPAFSGTALPGRLSCPTSRQCTLVGIQAKQVTFDPTSPGSPSAVAMTGDSSFAGAADVSCPATSQCTALDVVGHVTTFNPHVASSGSVYTDPVFADEGIACPRAGQCTVVGESGAERTFPPDNPSAGTSASVDTAPALTSIACPEAHECAAADQAGEAITFDPANPGGASSAVIDPNLSLSGIACPSVFQCVAVDDGSNEVIFNPAAPSGAAVHSVDEGPNFAGHDFTAVACPTVVQCTAVDIYGNEVTFDPTNPSTPASVALQSGTSLSAIACPGPTLCVAAGSSQAFVFDPRTSVIYSSRSLSTMTSATTIAVSCPTVDQCTTVDAEGSQETFDPVVASAADISFASVDPGRDLTGVACPSTVTCVAVDDHGTALDGSPQNDAMWPGQSVSGAGSLSSVACVSTSECVAVDSGGRESTGTGVPPTNTAPPAISGGPTAGQTLTEVNGTWSSHPTSYEYQWQDCDAGGANCQPISGATGETYTLTGADVGDTIRVQEVAYNEVGAGSPATSAPTGVVQEPVSPPIPSAPAVVPNAMQQVTGPTTARFTGSVVPDGVATTAYFEYGLDPKYAGGGPVQYGERTPPVGAGDGFVATTVSADVSGLIPAAEYHVRLVAVNADGTTIGPDETITTAKSPPPPPPRIAATVNVAPEKGHVLIRPPTGKVLPGTHGSAPMTPGIPKGFVPLTELRQIPIGSEIYAGRRTQSSLTLIDATGRIRHTQTAHLSGGLFTVTQTKHGADRGLTTFTLDEGSFAGAPAYAVCGAGAGRKVRAAPSAARVASLSPTIVQTLRARDHHGRFRTRGRNSVGTVRGTDFTTTERCDGTLTAVHQGIVDVLDIHRKVTVAVHAGHSYLARSPAPG